MQTGHESSIDHLDFPVRETEKKEEEELKHYTHPIDSNTYWCGKPRKYKGFLGGGKPPESRTCVDCLQLYIKHGGDAIGCPWWWRVHRAWYGSNCTQAKHECGA